MVELNYFMLPLNHIMVAIKPLYASH